MDRSDEAFLRTESGGGVILLAGAVAALIWANVFGGYEDFWTRSLDPGLGLPHDLRHWINDGLMTLFFFVVGLEIKEELVAGELRDRRAAALPIVAALGGMLVPAAIYLALNLGGEGSGGWGVPMATDIAFAMGVLAVLSSRIPSGLKLFVLTLAIVDDIGAILVIALFYSDGLALGWLVVAAGIAGVALVVRGEGAVRVGGFLLLGVALWYATYRSGVHATIAGVALGMLAPAKTSPGSSASIADRLQARFHPWTGILIVPLFALANAGVVLDRASVSDALSSSIGLGIIGGLVVGKVVGISGLSWVAVRSGIARYPDEVRPVHIVGASAVAGIGFTVSLFIATLAFSSAEALASAKVGILTASVIAGLLGVLILRRVHRQ